MSETTSIPIAIQASPEPPTRNAAVQRCCQARQHSLELSREKRRDDFDTQQYAGYAYRSAMPDLAGYENIRDFIACTAHGMVIGAIEAIEATKYLYAAQVALGVLHHEPKAQKQPAA
jgi:hypothetical protein